MEQGPEPEGESTELVRLREENARLRALLGIDDRPGDGHAVAWSPTLLSNPELGPAIDAGSSNAAKLKGASAPRVSVRRDKNTASPPRAFVRR